MTKAGASECGIRYLLWKWSGASRERQSMVVIATEIESVVEGLFKEEDSFEHVIIIYHAQTGVCW